MEIDILKEIVASVMKVDVREINMDTTFVMDLGADSLDIMRILMNIEEQFSILISKDCISKVNNLGDLVEIIKNA